MASKVLGGFGLGPAAVPTGISSFFVDTAELEAVERSRAIADAEAAKAAAAAERLERQKAHALQEGTAYPLGPPVNSRGHASVPQLHEAQAGGGGSISTLLPPVAAGSRPSAPKVLSTRQTGANAEQHRSWTGHWRLLGLFLCVVDAAVAASGWLEYRYCSAVHVPLADALPCSTGFYWCPYEQSCGAEGGSASSSWQDSGWEEPASLGCCLAAQAACGDLQTSFGIPVNGNGSSSWSGGGGGDTSQPTKNSINHTRRLLSFASSSGSWAIGGMAPQLDSVGNSTAATVVSPRTSWTGHGTLCWLKRPSLRVPTRAGDDTSTSQGSSWELQTADIASGGEGKALSPRTLALDASKRLRSYAKTLADGASGRDGSLEKLVLSRDAALKGSGSALLLVVFAKTLVLLALRLSLDRCTRFNSVAGKKKKRDKPQYEAAASPPASQRYQVQQLEHMRRYQYRFQIHEDNMSEDLRALLKLRKDSRRCVGNVYVLVLYCARPSL